MERISRRQLLQGGVAAGVVGAGALVALDHPWARTASRPARPAGGAAGHGRLVVVTLYGGNDGLDTVIPAQASAYQQARGAMARSPEHLLPLADGLFLHSALVGLKKLWDDHHLAIVRGVGYPNPNRSHFRSMDIWQSGSPDTAVSTGWLGRWLDATGSDPLRAISVGPNVPRLAAGERASASSVVGGQLQLAGDRAAQSAFPVLSSTYPGEPALAARVASTGADLLTVRAALAKALSSTTEGAGAGGTSLDGGDPADPARAAGGGAAAKKGAAKKGAAGSLGDQLDLVARLLRAGVPTRVFAVSMGGFDTHANERATHDRLLGQLDAALSTFLSTVGSMSGGGDVTVLVHSEFGRRVALNASGGTDHGTAAPVFVAGPAVKGGFVGDEPSLTALDAGDLRFTTDFRSVYATVLAGVLGVDPTVAVPKQFKPLAFV